MALMISSLEGLAPVLMIDLLERFEKGFLTERFEKTLLLSLPEGCDFLEHPDQIDTDNISVVTIKTYWTLLFIPALLFIHIYTDWR
jgi:hypothetical protein